MLLLPSATKLGQGYIFTGVCDSVHRGPLFPGGLLLGGAWSREVCFGGAWSWGVCSWGGAWLGECCLMETPRDGYCCGRYTSHWNAFLILSFVENWEPSLRLDRHILARWGGGQACFASSAKSDLLLSGIKKTQNKKHFSRRPTTHFLTVLQG